MRDHKYVIKFFVDPGQLRPDCKIVTAESKAEAKDCFWLWVWNYLECEVGRYAIERLRVSSIIDKGPIA